MAAGCCMPRWLLASAAAANPTAAATAASCMFRSMSCKPDKGSYANSTYPPTGSPACAKPWPTTTNCNSCWIKFPSTNGSGCKAAGRNNVVRRLIHYAEKLYGPRDRLLAEVGDSRLRPRKTSPDCGAASPPRRGAIARGMASGGTTRDCCRGRKSTSPCASCVRSKPGRYVRNSMVSRGSSAATGRG